MQRARPAALIAAAVAVAVCGCSSSKDGPAASGPAPTIGITVPSGSPAATGTPHSSAASAGTPRLSASIGAGPGPSHEATVDPKATWSGKVLRTDGSAVVGVVVYDDTCGATTCAAPGGQPSYTTDRNGRFAFGRNANLGGWYFIETLGRDVVRHVDVPSSKTPLTGWVLIDCRKRTCGNGYTFVLPPESTISGIVKDQSGKPVAGLAVVAHASGFPADVNPWQADFDAVTGPDGTFTIHGLASTSYSVSSNAKQKTSDGRTCSSASPAAVGVAKGTNRQKNLVVSCH